MDPITLGSLAAMALSGVVGNQADRWFCTRSHAVWRKLRRGAGEPRTEDLTRAIRRSQLLAVKLAISFYADLHHPSWRVLPGYSSEDITTPLLLWINDTLVTEEPWTSNPEQLRQTEERIERAFAHPEPHDGPAARRQEELREIALGMTISEMRLHVPNAIDFPRFENLLRQDGDPAKGEYPGWWHLFRALLAEEVKHNEPVRAILAQQGVARILETQLDLIDAMATLQARLTPVLKQLAPALAEIRAASASLDGASDRVETALAAFDTAARQLTRTVAAAVDENARKWFGVPRHDGKAIPLVQRVRDRPTELLIARYCIVPFLDRGKLLAGLLGWAIDTAGPRAKGRFYVAPGGSGKTRLGIELIDALHKRGWRTSFLSQRNGQQLSPGALAENMRADDVPGICVVLDYAEGQISRLEQAAQAAAAADETGPPIRIVAFARSAQGWWKEFASRPGPDVLFDRRPLQDMTGALDVNERQALFASARATFVQQRRMHGLAVLETGQSPDLCAAGSPLLVVAIAYLDASGIARTPEQSVFQVLFEEEQRHWRRVVDATSADEVEALARAATQVVLVMGTTEAAVLTLIRADPFSAGRDAHATLRQLRRLYGRSVMIAVPGRNTLAAVDIIDPIEPDLLGEHAAMTVLSRDNDGLLEATLRNGLTGEPLSAGDVAALLTVLSRSTHPVHERGTEAAALSAIVDIAAAVPTLSACEVTRLESALPKSSVALMELCATVAQHAVALSSTDTADAGLAERAGRLDNLGLRLSNLGHREDALAASKEALRLRRKLVGRNREAFLPDLASALNNTSRDLANLGRRDEAFSASEKAIRCSLELVDGDRAAFLPDFAGTLDNYGIRLSSLGRREEALDVTRQALRLWRELVRRNPEAFLPDLARALDNFSGDLANLSRREEAFAAGEAAVQHYRELVCANRDAFLPNLARALNNVSGGLFNLGRRQEALAVSEEATLLRRELAGKNRDAFLASLASALNNKSVFLSDLGRREDALIASEEAVQYWRELVSKDSDAFLPDLTNALDNLGVYLSNLGRSEDALAASEEAVRHGRKLVVKNYDAFLPDLARALINLGNSLSKLGRRDEALDATDEAVRSCRELVARNPEAFLPDMARALDAYGSVLLSDEQADRAIGAFTEAIRWISPLAYAHAAAFRPMLELLIEHLARALRAAGREEDAVTLHADPLFATSQDKAETPAVAGARRLFDTSIKAMQTGDGQPPRTTAGSNVLSTALPRPTKRDDSSDG